MATVEERFWSKVRKGSGCWEWMGAKTNKGYGKIHVNGKLILAHRLSYSMHKAAIPDGMFVCHSCDNPSCVRPDHLWVGTGQDNVADARSKNRLATGTRQGAYTHPERILRGEQRTEAKLTTQQVLEIRARYKRGGISCRELSIEYGVSKGNITNIIRGARWKHLL